MKFVRLALVLAMALCLTASVYAETQSVKVSGDLTVRGLSRADYDYRGSVPQPAGTLADPRSGFGSLTEVPVGSAGRPGADQNWAMSTTEVQIDAELTDNVATVIRIANERDWNVMQKAIDDTTAVNNGFGGYGGNANDFDIGLDLAYMKLKNFIYSPLSLTIGRQDLWFGKGFIVGSNHVFNNLANGLRLSAPEYTTFTAFDSVKAVLDYAPWTITGVYSSLRENAIADKDDVDLYGVNVGYVFDCYKAEAEGYWFFKYDRQLEQYGATKSVNNNDVQTLGVRGSFDPLETVTLAGEVAYQFGSYVGNRAQSDSIPRSAWALDVSGEWRGLMDKFAWKPKLGVEYILYSGEETDANAATDDGVHHGWDPMFRGKFDSAIREFVGTYYSSYDYRGNTNLSAPLDRNGIPSLQDASYTNQHQWVFSGSIQPIESVTVKGNANLFWLYAPIMPSFPGIQQAAANNQLVKGYIGTEFDIQAIWDYTEDVSFGLLTAWFVPGSEVYQNADKVASDIVGTVKVSF